MRPFNRLASILLLLSLIATCEALNITPPEVRITIINDLLNTMPIMVHCSSPAKDFGAFAIPKLGKLPFSFQPIPLLSEDVNCSVEWGGQTHNFDFYVYKRDKDRGNICCSWTVREDGPCVQVNQFSSTCYPWK
ncbi:hypothetical protein ACB092_03G084800 [Castanea dentata]